MREGKIKWKRTYMKGLTAKLKRGLNKRIRYERC